MTNLELIALGKQIMEFLNYYQTSFTLKITDWVKPKKTGTASTKNFTCNLEKCTYQTGETCMSHYSHNPQLDLLKDEFWS
jgi:hypothetical protein